MNFKLIMKDFNLYQKNEWFGFLVLLLFLFIGNNLLAQHSSIAEYGSQANSFEDDNPLYLVNIGDADLAVRYKKGKGIPVVFVHGSWDDHHSWMHVAEVLLKDIKNPIVLYDRRGHSASTPDKQQGTILQDVNDALLLIQKLGFEKAHFIGHSYGANIVVRLASLNPEKVKSIVLYEPPMFGLLKEKPEYKAEMQEVKKAITTAKSLLENGAIEEGTIQFIENAAFGINSWKELFDDRARSTMLVGYRTWLDQSNDSERLNVEPKNLNNFKGNITFISGTSSISVYTAVAKEIIKKVNTIKLEYIDGAGHGGLLSHSQETASIILMHLKNSSR